MKKTTYDLFLVLSVVGDEERQGFVHSTLLQEPLEFVLHTRVEVFKGGSKVVSTTLPVGLRSESGSNIRVRVKADVLDEECTVLTNSIDIHCTFCATLGNRDSNAERCARNVLGRCFALCVFRFKLSFVFVCRVEVGNAEHEPDGLVAKMTLKGHLICALRVFDGPSAMRREFLDELRRAGLRGFILVCQFFTKLLSKSSIIYCRRSETTLYIVTVVNALAPSPRALLETEKQRWLLDHGAVDVRAARAGLAKAEVEASDR